MQSPTPEKKLPPTEQESFSPEQKTPSPEHPTSAPEQQSQSPDRPTQPAVPSIPQRFHIILSVAALLCLALCFYGTAAARSYDCYTDQYRRWYDIVRDADYTRSPYFDSAMITTTSDINNPNNIRYTLLYSNNDLRHIIQDCQAAGAQHVVLGQAIRPGGALIWLIADWTTLSMTLLEPISDPDELESGFSPFLPASETVLQPLTFGGSYTAHPGLVELIDNFCLGLYQRLVLNVSWSYRTCLYACLVLPFVIGVLISLALLIYGYHVYRRYRTALLATFVDDPDSQAPGDDFDPDCNNWTDL